MRCEPKYAEWHTPYVLYETLTVNDLTLLQDL
jgi:hypothetical protein